MTKELEKDDNLSLERLIREVDYRRFTKEYVPSAFSIQFVNFIKLVNGTSPEENSTPFFHYEMLDDIPRYKNILIVAARGLAKSSIITEYMILYLAVFGRIPNFGEIKVGMVVCDTMDSGIKNLRNNLEHRYNSSEFLQKFVPKVRFTDQEWDFQNSDGKDLTFRGYGITPLALDSYLHLEDGNTRKIEDISVGDIIYGANGQLTEVIGKSDVFNRPMYRITLKDGRYLEVSDNHINSVIHKTTTGFPGKYDFRFERKNITTSDLLKERMFLVRGRKQHKSQKHPNKDYISKESLLFFPVCEPTMFPERVVPIDPYTLGLLLGDGTIRSNGGNELTGVCTDMDYFVQHIPYVISSRRPDKRNPEIETISIKNISPEMRELGLADVTQPFRFIPDVYKKTSVIQRLNLLQGLIDSDGCISARKVSYVVYFSSTSRRLCLDVREIVNSLGGFSYISEYLLEGRLTHWKVFIHLNQALSKLPRKLNKQKLSDRNTRIPITSIERIEDKPSQCIAVNNDNNLLIVNDYLVTHNTGIRGFKRYGERPKIILMDDLMSTKSAESKTIIRDIEQAIYKSARQALHPTKRKMIWIGTPFNRSDPLYQAAGSKGWHTRVYPICNKFPCSEKEFIGAWEDRFPYAAVREEYDLLKSTGKIDAFNQELMLRVLSDEDRLVLDEDIVWYRHNDVLLNLKNYHIYMTTDFATSEKQSADFSVIALWALDWTGRFHWFDGVVVRQDMAKNIDAIFNFVTRYKPLSVGVEISGQQQGFVSWLNRDMLTRAIWFNIASDKASGDQGLRPTTNKMVRFNAVLPLFKQRKMAFPEELKESAIMLEFIEQLTSITASGIKALHDDCVDATSQLQLLEYFNPHNPQQSTNVLKKEVEYDTSKYFRKPPEPISQSSYVV